MGITQGRFLFKKYWYLKPLLTVFFLDYYPINVGIIHFNYGNKYIIEINLKNAM